MNINSTLYYSYIIYSKKLNVKYIGSSTNKTSNPNKLLTQYKTSSNLVKYYIKNLGISVFEILETNIFNTQQEALNHEKYLIDKYNAVYDPKYLNISRQSEIFNVSGLIWVNDSYKEFYLLKDAVLPPNIHLGRLPRKSIHKKSTKKSMWVNKNNINTQIDVNELILYKSSGWAVGQTNRSSLRFWINNGISNKYLLKSDNIPLGYISGRILSEKFKEASLINLHKNNKISINSIFGKFQSYTDLSNYFKINFDVSITHRHIRSENTYKITKNIITQIKTSLI